MLCLEIQSRTTSLTTGQTCVKAITGMVKFHYLQLLPPLM